MASLWGGVVLSAKIIVRTNKIIDWELTPCHRRKKVLKYALVSISVNKSFMVGGGVEDQF